jgi:hypothetical protein
MIDSVVSYNLDEQDEEFELNPSTPKKPRLVIPSIEIDIPETMNVQQSQNIPVSTTATPMVTNKTTTHTMYRAKGSTGKLAELKKQFVKDKRGIK